MADAPDGPRRTLIGLAAGALILPAGCSTGPLATHASKDVTAVEDLMREHGILRRALLVFDGLSARLLGAGGSFDLQALADAAQLFRDFGEDYHERMLEEAFIFPRVKKAGGPAAEMADVLRAQHERGREVTDYVLSVSKSGALAANATPLGQALRGLVIMYEHHAAREDTILFPAWKAALSASEYADIGEQFETIEHKVFGGDGFDEASKTIAAVERKLGFADLARFTAPEPPPPEPARA